jgi:Ca2+-binding RTX toxin-like protein
VESVRGGEADDILRGNSVDNRLFGNEGNDEIYGSSPVSQGGTDEIHGGASDDYMQSNSRGNKIYYGEAGADEINGNTDPETVYGVRAMTQSTPSVATTS